MIGCWRKIPRDYFHSPIKPQGHCPFLVRTRRFGLSAGALNRSGKPRTIGLIPLVRYYYLQGRVINLSQVVCVEAWDHHHWTNDHKNLGFVAWKPFPCACIAMWGEGNEFSTSSSHLYFRQKGSKSSSKLWSLFLNVGSRICDGTISQQLSSLTQTCSMPL